MKQLSTLLTHLGREPQAHFGAVNPPIHQASTIIFQTLDDLETAYKGQYRPSAYGLFGVPVTHYLQDALAKLDGAEDAALFPSGLKVITTVLRALLAPGDHLLMVDSVYGPTREFCDHGLAPLGVETTYYDPLIGAGIAGLIRPNTKVVFTESPGSLTFEVQDVAAIASAAKAAGALTVLDNTWATPLFFRPFDRGVDVAVQAVTKYINGHSDVLMGVATGSEALIKRIRRVTNLDGGHVNPQDCYLALRGLRSMGARLARHQETALTLARWLEGRPEVVKVLHPALASCPGHDLWKRDFLGASGLFSFLMKPVPRERLKAMLEEMRLFAMGFSWGGYESLILPVDQTLSRTARPWREEGMLIRLHAGLEAPEDLIADLETGLRRAHGGHA